MAQFTRSWFRCEDDTFVCQHVGHRIHTVQPPVASVRPAWTLWGSRGLTAVINRLDAQGTSHISKLDASTAVRSFGTAVEPKLAKSLVRYMCWTDVDGQLPADRGNRAPPDAVTDTRALSHIYGWYPDYYVNSFVRTWVPLRGLLGSHKVGHGVPVMNPMPRIILSEL